MNFCKKRKSLISFVCAISLILSVLVVPVSADDSNHVIASDKIYTKTTSSMRLDGNFSYEKKQITLDVTLEAGSRLGAGDFVISFDPELVSYKSSAKGFNPDFFNIDERNIANGELKFHIISLSDIVTEETVLTVVFDVKSSHSGATADFTIDGSGLTDSLTNGIMLNFIGTSVLLGYQGALDFEINSTAPGATITAPSGGWVKGNNTFKVSCTSACYVAVSYDGGQTYTRLVATKNGDAYAFTAQNLDAETIIAVGLVGDLNGDGRIRAQEARQVLQASSGSATLTAIQTVAADLNSDDRIRAQEARTLLQASSGSATLSW